MKEALACRAVLEELARRFSQSAAGRSGSWKQRLLFDYEDVLGRCNSSDGDARAAAEEQLRAAAHAQWISLISHSRDSSLLDQIQFLPQGEEPLFAALDRPSPSALRKAWHWEFERAAAFSVPDDWHDRWRQWCGELAQAAQRGEVRSPFPWDDPASGAELLHVLARILSWPGESLIRFASCILCGNSKRLEELGPRLETALAQLGAGEERPLEQFGILRVPRAVLLHGPLRLEFAAGVADLGLLSAPVRLSEVDLRNAMALRPGAKRCLTVENETTFQEIAKLHSGILLVHCSYAGSAVRELFARLPGEIECFHFGDSDPAGFDILRDLRRRTGRTITALHMTFRPAEHGEALSTQDHRLLDRLLKDPALSREHAALSAMKAAHSKGRYEQELLGKPARDWPFY